MQINKIKIKGLQIPNTISGQSVSSTVAPKGNFTKKLYKKVDKYIKIRCIEGSKIY